MTSWRSHKPQINEANALQNLYFSKTASQNLSPTTTFHDLLFQGNGIGEDETLEERIVQAADGFTDKHKKVMDSLRIEMKNEEVNFDDALRVLEAPTRPQTAENYVLLKHADAFNKIESKLIIGDQCSTESVTSELSYDYMSGVWRMLQAERKSCEFVISPKGYEFDAEKTKWVASNNEVIKQIEAARNKCEQWLAIQCENEITTAKQRILRNPIRNKLT